LHFAEFCVLKTQTFLYTMQELLLLFILFHLFVNLAYCLAICRLKYIDLCCLVSFCILTISHALLRYIRYILLLLLLLLLHNLRSFGNLKSDIPQTMDTVQHSVPVMNQPLSQTFRESLDAPCPEPVESSPHPRTLFVKIYFNISLR
jgi:hypothetical protein